jgi:colanic acid/amylovoran biosynthesis glycosyltransferase
MGSQRNRKIAIVSVNANAYSESFIKAHIDLLEGEKFFLYGAYKPIYYCEKPLVLLIPSLKRFFVKYILKKNLLDYSIRYFLRKNNINVILAEYGPTGCAMMNIAKELNIPLVVHFHGYDASSVKLLNEYRDQYKQLFGFAGRIVAVSLQMQENLIKMGAKEQKVVYAPYGPASIFTDIVPDYNNSGSALFVGRFVDKKAPWLLIEIMKKVLVKGINIKLVMAGDGVLLDTCRGLVKFYGLENNIIFPGAVSHTEVKNLMAKSFCYIQHSVTTSDGETEGTPVSILEASQAGLPVISTKHAGIPDVIIHGETGFLVDEFDIDSMAEYLLILNSNRELAREMGMKAKIRISENFSLEKHISTLNNVLEEAIERR